MNLLLPTEAAHKLRISRAKFYQLIKHGKVQPYNVGGKTVFKEEELEALVEKGAGRKRKVPPLPQSSTTGDLLAEMIQENLRKEAVVGEATMPVGQ